MVARALIVCALGICLCLTSACGDGGDGDGTDSGPDAQVPTDGTVTDAEPADSGPTDAGPCGPGEFLVYGTVIGGECRTLPASVTLPVDTQAEAQAIVEASGCACACDEWMQLTDENRWVCLCCEGFPDCTVDIDMDTATTICEYDG